MKSHNSHTQLTKEMIDDIPIIDIHVHLPGTISPQNAWMLGVMNNFIEIYYDTNLKKYKWKNGKKSLPVESPFEYYTDIFSKGLSNSIELDEFGKPIKLEYNIEERNFKSFDRIMATIQGHRHPPGGIQHESDIVFILDQYLNDCISQKVFYTELQQNIRIAYQIYPNENKKNARTLFYKLLESVIKKFESHNVHLRFLHCFNKTKAASLKETAHFNAIEGAEWLEEASHIAPNVFVGIQSAGHEKDESGWPIHLKAGYDKAKNLGFGCEAHAGEGIGVEHMMDVVRTLPVTRIAHGFQVIEDEEAIAEIKLREITLVMVPIINLKLGACIHIKEWDSSFNELSEEKILEQISTNKCTTEEQLTLLHNITPLSKIKGGKSYYITKLYQHPFFELLRKHKLKIAICSDNPEIGGKPIKDVIKTLAGLSHEHHFPEGFYPLSAQELVQCCTNAINAAFVADSIKLEYMKKLESWKLKYSIDAR